MSVRSTKATKPPPLKTRLREAASEVILDAVEAVALERGMDGASIAAIAERAGVAVGTLYNYFPDRDAMFTALFRERRLAIAPQLAAAAKAAESFPFEVRLRAYIRGIFAAFDAHRPFVRLAIALDQQGKRVSVPEPNLLTVFTQHLESILHDAEEHERIPSGRSADYARMLVGALKGYNHWTVEQDRPSDPDLLVDTFLFGITRAKAP